MKIKVLYVDSDKLYEEQFVRYIEKNNEASISLDVREKDEIEGLDFSKYDVIMTDETNAKSMEKYDCKRLIKLSDQDFENSVSRYQKLSNIVQKIESIYFALSEKNNVTFVRKYILDNYDLAKISDEKLKEVIIETINEKTEEIYVPEIKKETLKNHVYSSIRGLGILDNLLSDEDVTEVMINDYDKIFVEKNGYLRRYEGACFESREQLMDIIQKIVGNAGREVNESNPIVDTRLEDGSRVNVVLSPIALNGHAMTIRRFSKEPMSIQKLIEFGSLTSEVADKLECLVKAKYNIIVSGGTGSGKTTFLNALSNFIPKDERIITIEDSAELQIVGIDNLISMETRNANSSGAGEISIRKLIKSSLRMRPDRIVVGEVRGEEALDMLQAMNTGHDGSLSTAHANSSRDMISRLSTMVLQGAAGLPLEAIKQQIASAVDIIIHLSRLRDHSRRVLEINEVAGYENGEIILNPLYVFEEIPGTTDGRVNGRLVRTANKMVHRQKLQSAGIMEEI